MGSAGSLGGVDSSCLPAWLLSPTEGRSDMGRQQTGRGRSGVGEGAWHQALAREGASRPLQTEGM
jgi:hypothetical protein